LQTGIRLADGVITSTPILKSIIGQDLRGLIRRAGILFQFQESCRSGLLPFTAEAAKMPIGSWHWLDIRSGNYVAHVVRTESPGTLPDNTKNRQSECFKNEYDLFKDGRIPDIKELLSRDTQRYSVITFGANKKGDLLHAALGMPSDKADEWLAYVNLSRRSQPSATEAPPAPKTPDPSQSLRFLNEVEQMIADRDQHSDDEQSA